MNPTESFVPLTAAPAPSTPREFQVAIFSGQNPGCGAGPDQRPADTTGVGAAKPSGFQSLEAQRSVALSGGSGSEKKIGEPRVTVQRDGDRVTHLRIQCTCGQILDLACVYDAPPAAK